MAVECCREGLRVSGLGLWVKGVGTLGLGI